MNKDTDGQILELAKHAGAFAQESNADDMYIFSVNDVIRFYNLSRKYDFNDFEAMIKAKP